MHGDCERHSRAHTLNVGAVGALCMAVGVQSERRRELCRDAGTTSGVAPSQRHAFSHSHPHTRPTMPGRSITLEHIISACVAWCTCAESAARLASTNSVARGSCLASLSVALATASTVLLPAASCSRHQLHLERLAHPLCVRYLAMSSATSPPLGTAIPPSVASRRHLTFSRHTPTRTMRPCQ
jgi:hypothetical protein